jgi:hypothetical protein
MKARFIGIIIIFSLLFSGCSINMVTGSGRIITETRKVTGFVGLTLAGIGEITLIQGTTESLKIEAEDNIMPHIVAEVNNTNGMLTIRMDKLNFQNVVRPTRTIRYTLTVKNLSSIVQSGLGTIQADTFKADTLSAIMSGAGRIQIDNLQTSNLTVTISGAGDIQLGGKTTQENITLSGLGTFRAGDLQSQSAKVNVSGAGGAQVWAISTLDVRLGGAGSVSYYGSPKITKEVTGVGVLNSLGTK